MRGNDYQDEVTRTMGQHLTREQQISNWSMGLAGEAGEAVDVLKKHLFHGHDLDLDAVTKELGDVLWYVAALCETLCLDLDDVMAANVAKLRARYPDGFSQARSRARQTSTTHTIEYDESTKVVQHGTTPTYGQAVADVIRKKTGGALPLSDHEPQAAPTTDEWVEQCSAPDGTEFAGAVHARRAKL